MAFVLSSFIPLFVLLCLYTMNFPLGGMVFIPILVAIVFTFIGHKMTSGNVWVKAVQGDNLLVVDINSTGVGKVYPGEVTANPYGGIDLRVDFGGGNFENIAYDRNMAHRVAMISEGFKKAVNSVIPFKKEQVTQVVVNEVGQKHEVTVEKLSFKLTEKQFETSAWRYDYLTFFFYNSETGTLLTKPQMSTTEKELLSEYITLNQWRATKQLCDAMNRLTNHMFELLGDRLKALLGNPIFQTIMLIVMILIIGFVIVAFVPQAANVIFPAKAAAAATAPPMAPIIGGGTP